MGAADVLQVEHGAQRPTDDIQQASRDKAAQFLKQADHSVVVTPADSARVCRSIDWHILPIMLFVYCLQSLDKTTLSYASVFGLIDDTHLVGNEFSWLGSVVYLAQLVFQPLVAYSLVKFPVGKFSAVMVFCWGAVLCGMTAAHDFGGLMASRLLLGAFEASVGKSERSDAIQAPLSRSTVLTARSPDLHCHCADVVQETGADDEKCFVVRHAGYCQHSELIAPGLPRGRSGCANFVFFLSTAGQSVDVWARAHQVFFASVPGMSPRPVCSFARRERANMLMLAGHLLVLRMHHRGLLHCDFVSPVGRLATRVVLPG